MVNPDLYLAATQPQLRQFCNKLDLLVKRVTFGVDEYHEASFEARIGMGINEVKRLCFDFSNDGEYKRYDLSFLHATPVTETIGPQAVLAQIRRYTESETAPEEIEDESGSDLALDERKDDETEDEEFEKVEGFLEEQSTFAFVRNRAKIEAHKSYMLNLLDEDLDAVGCDIGIVSDVSLPEELADDLHMIGTEGLGVGKFHMLEQELAVITPSDLIVCMNGLIACRLLPPNTKAYSHQLKAPGLPLVW